MKFISVDIFIVSLDSAAYLIEYRYLLFQRIDSLILIKASLKNVEN